nr:N-glycosylase/DNA lyase [Desulfobacterales bacterium]
MTWNGSETEKYVKEIKEIHHSIQEEIESRLEEFEQTWKKGKETDVFAELVFCILTPQSRARRCWEAVENLISKDFLLKGDKNWIARELSGVRFRNKKAEYILEARNQFLVGGKLDIRLKINQFSNVFDAREWLVQNIRGIGYKEASHFLRNIGLGKDLAILDRHILKGLKFLGVIVRIPDSLSRKTYLETEKGMKEFSKEVKIPVDHLDLVLWYKGTGEIFK